jgi:uncharacterized damage-inducible protein DinB
MKTNDMVVNRVHLTHQWLLNAVEGLTDEEFNQRLSYNAPPIGWHLWHITRFADRLQASFPVSPGESSREIWELEGLAKKWTLNPAELGIMESGLEMSLDMAANIPIIIGMERNLDYAKRVFRKADQAVADLSSEQFDEMRTSVRAYKREGERLVEATPEQTTTGADLVFHINHAARHLGSIEGLRGVIEST